MKLQRFIEKYGQFIESYKEYDNSIIRFKFAEQEKIMWLKGLVCDLLDMQVAVSHPATQNYWFKPA